MFKNFIALSTPFFKSALATIRINGETSLAITNTFLKKEINSQQHNKPLIRSFYIKNNYIDELSIVYYRAPASYTGDNLIEITCHGSKYIIKQIIEAFLTTKTTRYAQRGEFTKRALINNKINYLKAESINELINSENYFSHSIASKSYQGFLGSILKKIRAELNWIWANIEVDLDYPEFENNTISEKEIQGKLLNLLSVMQKMNKNSEDVLPFLLSLNIAIIGSPNVGKSTLLNSLLNQNKAITSDIPGTTRDVVEGRITIDDKEIMIWDTAGIRKETNSIEKEGIKKTHNSISNAQAIIWVSDDNTWTNINIPKDKKIWHVQNKSDKKQEIDPKTKTITVSALKKKIKPLKKAIQDWLQTIDQKLKNDVFTNYRQWNISQKIEENIQEWLIKYETLNKDLHGFYLNIINGLFDQLIGKDSVSDLENTLFKHFCVGK